MKSFLFISILILVSCVNTSAQTDKIPLCPTITVTGPNAAIPYPVKPIIFTASSSEEAEKFNLQYNWTISGGEIIEGQGTSAIKALQKNIGGSLTLTVEVNGLPQECKKTASETVFIDPPPQIHLFDEFSIVPSRIDKARLDNFLTSLRNDPSAVGYIIESFAKGTSRKIIQQKSQKVSGYLKIAGIEKDRIILLNCFSNKNLTQFYSVPAGAIPPTCDEHVFAK